MWEAIIWFQCCCFFYCRCRCHHTRFRSMMVDHEIGYNFIWTVNIRLLKFETFKLFNHSSFIGTLARKWCSNKMHCNITVFQLRKYETKLHTHTIMYAAQKSVRKFITAIHSWCLQWRTFSCMAKRKNAKTNPIELLLFYTCSVRGKKSRKPQV